MRYVNVVPVRRMPPDRPWLTYQVPETMAVQVGSLVTIPLRGRPILGVVWELLSTSPNMAVQNISAVHLSAPVVSTWQRRVCDVMATTGSASLGEVLWRVIPKLTATKLTKSLTGNLIGNDSATIQDSSFLWYRYRQQALDRIQNIVQSHSSSCTVIITPTNDDAEEIVRIVEKLGRVAIHLHGQTPPTVYAKWFNRIRNGEVVTVVGGIGIAALPFPKSPLIILDQEEHHAHKQTAQFPYYDNRIILRELGAPLHVTTPAPSLDLYRHQQPTPPTAAHHRALISLHGPRLAPLMSDEALNLIDQAAAEKKMVVCISPRRGYASLTSCRSCGTILTCPSCGRSAAIFRGVADEARCHSCQTAIPLHTLCPKCGSADWSFHGYGIEQTVATLQRLRPNLVVTPMLHPQVTADVAVDTYQSYRSLRLIKNIGTVIMISGDSLLTMPDYSIAERAWQYLSRLQAEVPAATIAVQTLDPESTFWQRWLHSDDRAWYEDELKQRQRLQVPPFTQQWIALYRGEIREKEKKMAEVQRLYPKEVTVRALPSSRKNPQLHRLLLSFNDQKTVATLPWIKLFPLPWHLDQYPTSWFD